MTSIDVVVVFAFVRFDYTMKRAPRFFDAVNTGNIAISQYCLMPSSSRATGIPFS